MKPSRMSSLVALVIGVTACCIAGASGPASLIAGPLIVSVAPDRVTTAGGDRVTILGERFQTGLTVTLDGARLPDVEVVSPNQVELVTPPRATGPCVIELTNADGSTARTELRYIARPAPPVASAAPPPPGRDASLSLVPVIGAPLPAGFARPSPPAFPPPPPVPHQVAAEFMTRLARKLDVTPVAAPTLQRPVPAGVVFDWQFSDAWQGALGAVPIVHFEGRLESVDAKGQRAWLPFLLYATIDEPARVLAFQTSLDPAATRDQLMAAIEAATGQAARIDWTNAVRPLPAKP